VPLVTRDRRILDYAAHGTSTPSPAEHPPPSGDIKAWGNADVALSSALGDR
jgi:hypothetical protein